MRLHRLLVGILVLSLLAACRSQSAEKPLPEGLQRISLLNQTGEETVLAVETAMTPEAWERGLMERTELAGDGMLFVFPDEVPRAFWMKNTLIPLDILYFDASGRFVSMETMAPCTADPCRTYISAGPVRYAVEVAAGRAAAWGVGAGWTVRW